MKKILCKSKEGMQSVPNSDDIFIKYLKKETIYSMRSGIIKAIEEKYTGEYVVSFDDKYLFYKSSLNGYLYIQNLETLEKRRVKHVYKSDSKIRDIFVYDENRIIYLCSYFTDQSYQVIVMYDYITDTHVKYELDKDYLCNRMYKIGSEWFVAYRNRKVLEMRKDDLNNVKPEEWRGEFKLTENGLEKIPNREFVIYSNGILTTEYSDRYILREPDGRKGDLAYHSYDETKPDIIRLWDIKEDEEIYRAEGDFYTKYRAFIKNEKEELLLVYDDEEKITFYNITKRVVDRVFYTKHRMYSMSYKHRFIMLSIRDEKHNTFTDLYQFDDEDKEVVLD